MRPALLVLLVLASVPAFAQNATYDHESRFLENLYNMCRGGGFAYELTAPYASQRDERCLNEAKARMAEGPQRSAELGKLAEAIKAAEADRNMTPDELARLKGQYEQALGRVFFVDYCMEKNAPRFPGIKDGSCGYVDNRFWSSRWRDLNTYLGMGPSRNPQAQAAANGIVKHIFDARISLPAKPDDVTHELALSGFDCTGEQYCILTSPIFSYKNGQMTELGGNLVRYTFTVEGGQITAVKAELQGVRIR